MGPCTRFFHRVGYAVGTRPVVTLIVVLCLTVVLGSGVSVLETEARGEKLLTDQNAPSFRERDVVESVFVNVHRPVQLLATPLKSSGTSSNNNNNSILNANDLTQFHRGYATVWTTSAAVNEKHDTTNGAGVIDFGDICLRSASGNCQTASIVDIWENDLATITALTPEMIIQDINNVTLQVDSVGGRLVMERILGGALSTTTTPAKSSLLRR